MSNIGGTATLIGDPPNIMIGSAIGLTFNQFLLHLAPIAILVILPVTLFFVIVVYRGQLAASEDARARIMQFNESEAITDRRLLARSLAVHFVVILGFVLAHSVHQEPATIAMLGAAALLFLDNWWRRSAHQSKNIHHAVAEAEWITLFFFIGLFILVHGLDRSGVVGWLAQELIVATGGDLRTTAFAVLWGSALISAFLDNIPFVATMIPLIQAMAPTLGGEDAIAPLWWSLAFGACLGRNGTLIGASANLVVAGFAERAGQPIKFVPFMRSCFLLMSLSVAISHVYIYFRYF